MYLYCFGTKNTNNYYFCSFLICLGGRGVLIFLGHAHTSTYTKRHTHTHSHNWLAHTEVLSVFTWCSSFSFPSQQPVVTDGWNKWIYRPLIHIQGHRVIHWSAYKHKTNLFRGKLPCPCLSPSHTLTQQRFICACRHVLEQLSVSESKHVHSYMHVLFSICVHFCTSHVLMPHQPEGNTLSVQLW